MKINLNLRNRIAFYYTAVTALFTALVFLVIYYIVFNTVYDHLDGDLRAEQSEVANSIIFIDNEPVFTNNYEWEEKEHGQIEVNPTFIQVIDKEGNNIRKTKNLLDKNLVFHPGVSGMKFYNLNVAGSSVRQIQFPLKDEDGNIKAYLIVAIPLEESALVLSNLKNVLIISFPVVLFFLFMISRFIAGKVISPVNNIISTAEHITKENLNERIPVLSRKDELSALADTINSLLERLQETLLREKQFTADASHELRTPISVIKGTLEVLVRKERNPEQYEEKIKYVIGEVDRMALLVEHLLSLARYESGKIKPMKGEMFLIPVIDQTIDRLKHTIGEKNITISTEYKFTSYVNADVAMTEIIIENLLSNAVKYSPVNGRVILKTEEENGTAVLSVTNFGELIPEEKLHRIFDRFYRVDQTRSAEMKGNGLGLAIVKRLTDLQGLSITAESNEITGTVFRLIFPS